MMYIEHTPIERQEILRNHVHTHVQEVETSFEQRSQVVDQDHYFNRNSQFNNIEPLSVKYTATTVIPCENGHESNSTAQAFVDGAGAQSAFKTVPEQLRYIENEQYELLEIEEDEVDGAGVEVGADTGTDATQQPQPAEIYQNQNEILFELEDGEDIFEYIIVPKHTRKIPRKIESEFLISSITPQRSPLPRATRRPIPPAISINNFKDTVHNNRQVENASVDPLKSGVRLLNGYWPKCNNNYASDADINQYSCGNSIWPPYEETDAFKAVEKDTQMDIFNKLRQLLNFNSYKFDTQERSRKRKTPEIASPHHIKYRKVDNNFPEYIPSRAEYDTELRPKSDTFSHENQQRFSQKPIIHSGDYINMPQRRSIRTIDEAPKLRKSMFVSPQTTRQLVKNVSYADLEFSDDDEPQLIRGFGIKNLSATSEAPRLAQAYKMPMMHRDNDSAKQPPPPLLETGYGHFSLMSKTNTLHKPTYAETLKQNMHATNSTVSNAHSINSNVIIQPLSSSSSSTMASTREFSGYSQRLSHHPWAVNAHSILMQEHETEERDKYQQLLEQMMPRLYGGEQNIQSNKKSNIIGGDMSQGRNILHGTLNIGRPFTSVRSKKEPNHLKRPPLSSTINLDDDDNDNDVLLTSVTQRRQKCTLPTIIIDEDDISDIIDLADDDCNVVMSCSSKHKENSALSLNAMHSKTKRDKLPYVEPVNSLKDRFKASPHLKDNWLQCWQSDWERKHKNRQQEVTEALIVVEKLATERRAAETELHERLRTFQIVDPDVLVIDDFPEPLVEDEPDVIEFNDQQKARIQAAIYGPQDQILISKFGLNITRRDIATLLGHNWLNDEVINFYMNLLTERGEQKHGSHGMPQVYAMNTFFVPRLMQAGHSGVKRWTRKVDIFTKDIIPIPVHVAGVHWCMAIIHILNRTIKYYDSMGVANPNVLKALEQYLRDESMDKRKRPFDTSQFEIESVRDVPRQMNGSDCGVFSCMFAEYVTRNRPITFSQANMEYFRHKMILEIVQGELMR